MKKTFLFVCLAFSLNALAQIPTTGLVAYYPFTGNANDLSGNSNNGIVNGATLTTDRFGNSNSAYLFNGTSDNIKINSNSALDITNGSFSISVWIQSNNYNQINQHIFWRGDSQSGYDPYAVSIGAGTINFRRDVSPGSNVNKISFSNSKINTTSFQHIIALFNSSSNTMELYLNGLLMVSQTLSGTINYSTSTFVNFIGSVEGNSQFFNGKIDDIRIYNRILNESEISSLYNEGICYTKVSVTDTLYINATITGFNPVTYQNTIKIWPNPTNNYITIDNGNIANLSGYKLKITNSLSQEVFQSAITQQLFKVDLSTWTGNGIYFVHIINAQGATIDIKKIVLQ